MDLQQDAGLTSLASHHHVGREKEACSLMTSTDLQILVSIKKLGKLSLC